MGLPAVILGAALCCSACVNTMQHLLGNLEPMCLLSMHCHIHIYIYIIYINVIYITICFSRDLFFVNINMIVFVVVLDMGVAVVLDMLVKRWGEI